VLVAVGALLSAEDGSHLLQDGLPLDLQHLGGQKALGVAAEDVVEESHLSEEKTTSSLRMAVPPSLVPPALR
jgi:hypothetical protein